MRTTHFLSLVLSLTTQAAHPAQLPNLNAPFFSEVPKNVLQLPTVFSSRDNEGEYFVLPLGFRVQVKDGRAQLKFRKFQNGKARVEAALVPYPESFESHPHYQGLIAEVKTQDPGAKFLYPVLRNARAKLLGPQDWAESVELVGGTGDPKLKNVVILVKADRVAEVEEHLKRPIGLVGQMEFSVTAYSGTQTIEWPVGFAFHLGEYHAP